jgi:hypothetical protein
MANKDTAKQWFEKGDKPTQAQFAQVFEWLRWKDEAVDIATDPALVAALLLKLDKTVFDAFEQGQKVDFPAGDASYNLDANYLLEKVIILPPIDAPGVKIGDTDGGEEISPETPVSAANGGVIEVNVFANGAARTIYFGGIPVNTKIIFIKRKIKTA